MKQLFKDFKKIDKILGEQLIEISVKQHQVALILENTLYFPNIQKIMKYIEKYSESYITFHNDFLCIIIGGLSLEEMKNDNIFFDFISVIKKMSEEICQCPALEYVVSLQYIKCYLDKTGLKVSDLEAYEKILDAPGSSELEMHPQRPYLLFINDEM